MLKPPLPSNEAARLAALYSLNILDTPPEERFDRITRLAQRLFDAPIVMISLVDANREWFKSAQGLLICEGDRDTSFCGHTILGNAPLIIPDALQDPRFADNPQVTQDHIRFYAGVPLTMNDGVKIGTLCIKDRRPRQVTEDQITALKDLGALAESELMLNEIVDLQRQLALATEAAENANQAKNQFLANMSHELRAPVHAIVGFSEMLHQDMEESGQDEYIPDVKKIHRAGQELHTLINDVLDLSRIEAGKMELHLEEFDIVELLHDVTSLIKPLVEKNANTFHIESPEDPGVMRADLVKMRQVLFNLLSNACKFTEHGRIGLEVTRWTQDSREWLSFKVTDTGIGMTPEQVSHLFQDFSQEDTSARKHKDMGLGLAISRRLCRLMGGDIAVTSEIGKGTAFFVRVPAVVQELETQEQAPVALPSWPEAGAGRLAETPAAGREGSPAEAANAGGQQRPADLQDISAITAAAVAIETGTFDAHSLQTVMARSDELGRLARVFAKMAAEVHSREQRLLQQVQQARAESDRLHPESTASVSAGTAYRHPSQEPAGSLREA